MMGGVFVDWQPRYSAVGILTTPIDPDTKKPAGNGIGVTQNDILY